MIALPGPVPLPDWGHAAVQAACGSTVPSFEQWPVLPPHLLGYLACRWKDPTAGAIQGWRIVALAGEATMAWE